MPPVATPQTLGVDDFCFRKCKTYGTALIDLERSRPIALLKDAKAETLAEWLKAHPGIKVVSRDRSKTYESGIRQGAPGKCAYCGLFFQDGDLMEIDHKIPRSKGGKDSYDNLQLLHGHCHDVKTAADNAAVRVPEIDEDYLNLNPF